MGVYTGIKSFTKQWYIDMLYIVIGSLIMAAGYVFFVIPYMIVPGGVYGIAIILHHTFGLPTGMTGLVLNIPLVIWGIKELGPKFGWKTILGMTLTSIAIDVLTYFWGDRPLVLENELILSPIFGGLLIGGGLALIFRARATSGGTDIVAQIMNKHTGISMGQLIIMLDIVIVLAGTIIFADIKLALYALITIYVTGKVIDSMTIGLNYKKGALIISEKYQEIADKIKNSLNRGGTYLHGSGMLNNNEKKIIFTAINRRELVALQYYVKEIDPEAFMTILDVRDVRGEGFKSFEEI
ncbi:MAG: YitT family protein [Candidatus Delongbacteria bacterium]|nr:YitT family protein [Candidatus Delongbacteria bacterium]